MAIQVRLMLLRLVPFRRYEVITSVVAPTAQAAQETFGRWMMWLDNVRVRYSFGEVFKEYVFFAWKRCGYSWTCFFSGGFSVFFLKVFGVETQKEFSTDFLKRSTVGQMSTLVFPWQEHTLVCFFGCFFIRINEINDGVSSPGNKPFMLDGHNLPMWNSHANMLEIKSQLSLRNTQKHH